MISSGTYLRIIQGLLQLVDKSVTLKHRAEFLRYQSGARIHAALTQGFNLTGLESTGQKGLVSIQKDNVEGAIRFSREGAITNKVDSVEIGASYFNNDYADISAQVKVDPTDLKGKKDLFLGVGKKFAPNFYVKARTNWFSGVSAYYVYYMASKNCSMAGTMEVSHCSGGEPTPGFKGCCDYPFNFGVKLNFNA